MSESIDVIQLLHEKAKVLPATVVEVKSMAEAMDYVVATCAAKAPCEVLLPEPGASYGPPSANNVPTYTKRVIAAPDLGDALPLLEKAAAAQGIEVLTSGLREHMGGFDMGVAKAEMAVADSVTCVVNSDSEEVRIATMIGEICVLIVPRSKVVKNLEATAPTVRALMTKGTPSYTAFITGPSRTSDIERVSALGVHGPLELHLILLEG